MIKGLKFSLAALGLLLCLLVSHGAKADALGLFMGVGVWAADNTGDIQSGSDPVDVEDELGFDSENLGYAYVALEHFIPLIPNLRLQYTDLGYSGSDSLNTGFNGVDFDGRVDADFDLSKTDLIAYWRILDNILNLDIGAQVTLVNGDINITQQDQPTNDSSTSVDEVLPLAYVSAGVDLPLTGLSATTSIAGYKFDGDQMLDMYVRVNYEVGVMGAELGWRHLDMELDDLDDIDADLSFSGPYLGVNVHF